MHSGLVEGPVPTRGLALWHRDDEPLFGECGEAKLVVSVSFGSSAVFKWKGQSCPEYEGNSCCLGLLVMDGQCQDEFLHCTDPGLEQERINVTFRWIIQHVASCPFLRAGVACCLQTCAQGSSVSAAELVGFGTAWGLWVLLVVLLFLRVLALLIYPLVCGEPEVGRRVFCWALHLGIVRQGHCLRSSPGVPR